MQIRADCRFIVLTWEKEREIIENLGKAGSYKRTNIYLGNILCFLLRRIYDEVSDQNFLHRRKCIGYLHYNQLVCVLVDMCRFLRISLQYVNTKYDSMHRYQHLYI